MPAALMALLKRVGFKGLVMGGGIILAVALLAGQSIRLGHEQRQVKKFQDRLGECRVNVAGLESQRQELETAITDQNAAIDRLKAEADLAATKGSEAAERALAAGRVRRDVPRSPGPAAMNGWMAEVFPPAPGSDPGLAPR